MVSCTTQSNIVLYLVQMKARNILYSIHNDSTYGTALNLHSDETNQPEELHF